MKVELQPAYLLHARPFSETSLLVDLFTREHGRLMLLAKGARRNKSRVRGVLLPFKFLLASWAGKGQLPTLTAVEQGGYTAEMTGNLLASGYYMNELLLRLLHRHDSHENLFVQYRAALAKLNAGNSPRWSLRIFEKQLLHHIGFGAVLERDAISGEAIHAQRNYRYRVEKGPISITSQHAQSVPANSQYAVTIRGSTLRALHEERLPEEQELQQARCLLRLLLNCQLNGYPLRSRRVAVEMQQYRVGVDARVDVGKSPAAKRQPCAQQSN